MKKLITVLIFMSTIITAFANTLYFGQGGKISFGRPTTDITRPPDSMTLSLFHFDSEINQDTCGNDWALSQDNATRQDINGVIFKFGTSSFRDSPTYLAADGWQLTASDGTMLNIGESDFTFEFWLNVSMGYGTTEYAYHPAISFTAVTATSTLACNVSIYDTPSETNLSLIAGYDGDATTGSYQEITQSAWHHICFQRSGGIFVCHIDGVPAGSSNGALATANIVSSSITIGRADDNNLTAEIYLDELAISNIARYPDGLVTPYSFTPPTAPYERTISPKLSFSKPVVNIPFDMVLWLDAADESTITADGSGYVSTWADKSSYGNNAIGTNPPRTGLYTLNGLQTVGFDGTDYMTLPSDVIADGATPFTIFMVWQGSIYDQPFWFGSNTYGQYYTVKLFSDNRLQFLVSKSGNYGAENTFFVGTPYYTTFVASATGLFVNVDGVRSIENLTAVKEDIGTAAALLGQEIGGGSSYRLVGFIAEFVKYHRELSSAEILQVESYLKDKWGF